MGGGVGRWVEVWRSVWVEEWVGGLRSVWVGGEACRWVEGWVEGWVVVCLLTVARGTKDVQWLRQREKERECVCVVVNHLHWWVWLLYAVIVSSSKVPPMFPSGLDLTVQRVQGWLLCTRLPYRL